jgi:hypothetical protein
MPNNSKIKWYSGLGLFGLSSTTAGIVTINKCVTPLPSEEIIEVAILFSSLIYAISLVVLCHALCELHKKNTEENRLARSDETYLQRLTSILHFLPNPIVDIISSYDTAFYQVLTQELKPHIENIGNTIGNTIMDGRVRAMIFYVFETLAAFADHRQPTYTIDEINYSTNFFIKTLSLEEFKTCWNDREGKVLFLLFGNHSWNQNKKSTLLECIKSVSSEVHPPVKKILNKFIENTGDLTQRYFPDTRTLATLAQS